jgi:hypothetical protein
VEISKKEDETLIKKQSEDSENLKKLIKEIYKLGFIYNFTNDLSNESKLKLKKVLDEDPEFKNTSKQEEDFFNFANK